MTVVLASSGKCRGWDSFCGVQHGLRLSRFCWAYDLQGRHETVHFPYLEHLHPRATPFSAPPLMRAAARPVRLAVMMFSKS